MLFSARIVIEPALALENEVSDRMSAPLMKISGALSRMLPGVAENAPSLLMTVPKSAPSAEILRLSLATISILPPVPGAKCATEPM